MRLYGLRGAVCAENTAEDITKNVGSMCEELFKRNGLNPTDIVSIQFTMTGDLTALNPAAALRKAHIDFDVTKCALFCSSEPPVANALPRCIRVLVTAYMADNSPIHHVYQNGAEVLRPDFVEK